MKNLEKMMARVLGIAAMVCGIVMFASCQGDDLDVNEGYSVKATFTPNDAPGIKIINDSLQRDTIPYGGITYKTILKRSLKALDRREIVVDNFEGQTFDETFTAVQGEEKYVRQDGKFLIYGREIVYKKNISVGGHVKEIRYKLYQERATFTLNSYEFDYIEWNVRNASDDFAPALISTMDKKNELDYRNEIATTYYGYNQKAHEIVAWFSDAEPTPEPQPEKPTYTTTWDIKYTTTYVTPSWEKIQVNPDDSRETVEKDVANLPIKVTPETNWTLNVDQLGTYVSNAFNKTLISKTPRKSGNFSYNVYTYRVYNTVDGQMNSVLVEIPGDIVHEKDDEKQEYANTELVVTKGSEATTFSTETSANKVYKYNVVANVTYGATQSVNLPGTINVKKAAPEPEPNHEHGKVKEVIFTTTQNENCSFYKSVCVIVFEDSYRSVGMAENDSKTFTFNMSSTTNGVNSAVYADGKWQVSKAEDNTSAKCMIWRNEGGQAKRTLDFVTATAKRWNNGHNTIKDPRRSYTIIDGGYGVTLSLNGSAGQSLHF